MQTSCEPIRWGRPNFVNRRNAGQSQSQRPGHSLTVYVSLGLFGLPGEVTRHWRDTRGESGVTPTIR